jgi:nucleotide-binding universal stress UspA family protein
MPAHAPDGSEIVVDLHDVGMKVTRKVRQVLDAANLPYRLDTELGDPADAIANAAEAVRVDEVVMGSRGLGQWKGLALGSVAYKVIHRVAVPVTVVGTPAQEAQPPAAQPGRVHRVLLAVDGSQHSLRAADYVCKLHESGMPIEAELLNVTIPIPAGYVRGFVTQEMIDNYHREEGERAVRGASEALQAAAVRFTSHLAVGHAAEKIVQVARERQCHRIVLGTRGLGAIAGLALGSVAYQVVHLSPIPVTLVK